MKKIFNELTGGFEEKKRKELEEKRKTSYDIFVQFDNDEPILAFPYVDKEDAVIFEINALDDKKKDKVYFKDNKTGKTFKIFIKKYF